MKQCIGFATQFYTLWSVEKVPVYVTDAYGKHWLARVNEQYTYHKNVSKSLEEVRRQYPTLTIDEGLRGKTMSFEREGADQRPDHIFWKGKYQGQLVAEVAACDWNYILWAYEVNMGNHASHIESLPQWVEHCNKLQADALRKQENADAIRKMLPIGQPIAVNGLTNGYNLVRFTEWGGMITHLTHPDLVEETILCVSFKAEVEGLDAEIVVQCSDAVRVNGMYPYTMPIVNGKAQKTKNKTLTITPTGVWVSADCKRILIYVDPLTSTYGPTIVY